MIALEEFRAVVREEMARASGPVVSTEEGAALARLASADRFRRWAKAARITPVGKGRWARSQIEAALRRECRERGVRS